MPDAPAAPALALASRAAWGMLLVLITGLGLSQAFRTITAIILETAVDRLQPLGKPHEI